VQDYKHVQRWAAELAERPAVIRGRKVNRTWGDESEQAAERHSAADLD
jgi:GST-like protein